MRLPGRMAAAIEVLESIEALKRPVSLALRDWGQSHRFAGSRDRAVIGNLVYDVMRSRLSHAFIMRSDQPRALVLSVVVRDWGEDPEQINASFALDRFAPDPISKEELELLNAPDPLAGAPEHVVANLAQWLTQAFKQGFGENWVAEAKELCRRPPLDMRVNRLSASRERVIKSLKRFDPRPTEIAQTGLRIKAGTGEDRAPNVLVDAAYQKGWLEIQDEGSQIVAALSAVQPGQQVLDFCAGGGGKTLALAAMMGNKGQIFAHDSDRHRLAPIYERLKRAAVRNAQVREPEKGSLNNLAGKMDKVVVDAPCTGSGTWRRHPDAKWRLSEAQLEKRLAEQSQILDEAAPYVRKGGGELIYITCSLLPAENQSQIEAFLERNPEFTLVDPQERWQKIFPHAHVRPLFSQWGTTLSPLVTNTDGFFVSVLIRK
ncbi:Sun protein [hydrothermal vent metagenome]|uniref:Sun protein n=1 Tax=hydrothermal vent metagenome TaxID=652676 RepID=A0A3B0TU44_9ZZZZ